MVFRFTSFSCVGFVQRLVETGDSHYCTTVYCYRLELIKSSYHYQPLENQRLEMRCRYLLLYGRYPISRSQNLPVTSDLGALVTKAGEKAENFQT